MRGREGLQTVEGCIGRWKARKQNKGRLGRRNTREGAATDLCQWVSTVQSCCSCWNACVSWAWGVAVVCSGCGTVVEVVCGVSGLSQVGYVEVGSGLSGCETRKTGIVKGRCSGMGR